MANEKKEVAEFGPLYLKGFCKFLGMPKWFIEQEIAAWNADKEAAANNSLKKEPPADACWRSKGPYEQDSNWIWTTLFGTGRSKCSVFTPEEKTQIMKLSKTN